GPGKFAGDPRPRCPATGPKRWRPPDAPLCLMYAWEVLDPFRQFHPRWFESVDAYIPGDEHASVFRDAFDQRWALRRNGMWYVGEPARAEMPDQGWKLHISVPTRATTEALRRVFPVLRDEGDPPPYALGGTCAI